MNDNVLKPVRVRFAPSPTGELHIGSARTALYNYWLAKQTGGALVLRIEDTDQTRYVPGSMDRFLADLKWLGLSWNEGPDVGGEYGPYIQSERTELYRAAANRLIEQGQAYKCYCTPDRLREMREAQMAAGQPSRYDRHCFGLSEVEQKQNEGRPFTIRMKVPEGITEFADLIRGKVTIKNNEIDDQVLLKSDGFPTYHLAMVVDDHAMKITHVLRSEEWLPSTPKHILLYQMFGWEQPYFAHLPLVLNTQKKKMSKRKDGAAVWVATYRDQGYLSEALVNYLALVGWNPGTEQEFFTPDELIQKFSLDRVHRAGAVFDLEKLRFFNAHYLRLLSDAAILRKFKDGNFWADYGTDLSDDELLRWVQISRERLVLLIEFSAMVHTLIKPDDYSKGMLIFKKSDSAKTHLGLTVAFEELSKTPAKTWTSKEDLQAVLSRVVEGRGLTNGDVFWPVRVALSGLEQSPGPHELLWALGRAECLRRLESALKKLL